MPITNYQSHKRNVDISVKHHAATNLRTTKVSKQLKRIYQSTKFKLVMFVLLSTTIINIAENQLEVAHPTIYFYLFIYSAIPCGHVLM